MVKRYITIYSFNIQIAGTKKYQFRFDAYFLKNIQKIFITIY